jgi:signal transduction histidine kinase
VPNAVPIDAGRARRTSRGIAWRLGGAFTLVALTLVALGVLVSVQAADMGLSLQRMLEEQREAAYSRDLVHELRALTARIDARAGGVVGETEAAEMREGIERAEELVALLARGPQGRDPSAAEHEEEEAALYDSLVSQLELLRAACSPGAGIAALDAPLQRSREDARVLNETMRHEAEEAAEELGRDARDLRAEVLWITLAALVVLVAVLLGTGHSILRPLLELREGARRIGSGELAHRVTVRRPDEIGELAFEFNRMAEELGAMRGDLESRVEQRTREFLRAARLAGLGTMAAGLAHEINNPLASIASCAEGLERRLSAGRATPEEEHEYLQIIAKEAYRAHGITSRLLEFARCEPGARVPFSPQELLREIQLLLEHRLKRDGVELTVSCDPGLPTIEGDPDECKQVLLNLIHNALDASPPGGTIRVTCAPVGGEVHLTVEDQGPGIPPEDLERVFDPFFTTKAPGKGTGLGLAIVHRIVESHGGRVELESSTSGVRVRVRLPLARGAAA